MDWRWDLIKSNWSLSPAEREVGKIYVDEIASRKRDPVLTALWSFYDDLQANLRVDLDFPSMAKAYEIMTERPKARQYIEGMVLCRVPAQEISMQCGISPSVITAYEAMFFDVRPYLHLEAWICELVFSGDLVRRLNQFDVYLLSRRVAWLMGAGVFHCMYGGGRACPELVKHAERNIHEISRKSALLRSMTRGHMDEELDVALIQEVVQATRVQQGAGDGVTAGGFEAKHANAVVSMLSAVTLSVADPSLEATLQQPARDQRTSDIVRGVLESRAVQPVVAEIS